MLVTVTFSSRGGARTLPPGLTLDERTGQLTGVLTEWGEFDVVVDALHLDELGRAVSNLSVAEFRLSITRTVEESGVFGLTATVGMQYVGSLPNVAGGRPPLVFGLRSGGVQLGAQNGAIGRVFSIPDGLVVDNKTGQVTGIPTKASVRGQPSLIGIEATDANGYVQPLGALELVVVLPITATWREPYPLGVFDTPYTMVLPVLV